MLRTLSNSKAYHACQLGHKSVKPNVYDLTDQELENIAERNRLARIRERNECRAAKRVVADLLQGGTKRVVINVETEITKIRKENEQPTTRVV